MRLEVIGHDTIETVGNYESFMVSQLPLIFVRFTSCAFSRILIAGGERATHRGSRVAPAETRLQKARAEPGVRRCLLSEQLVEARPFI